jgi:hypothetical protein
MVPFSARRESASTIFATSENDLSGHDLSSQFTQVGDSNHCLAVRLVDRLRENGFLAILGWT